MIRLSARQYKLLLHFERRKDIFLDECRKFNQITFGALLYREYIAYNRRTQHFYLTRLGSAALIEFKSVEILRKAESGPFSHYFSEQKIAHIVEIKKGNKVA
jgi:hypothetical protein